MNTQVISWQKAMLALALVATVATAGFLSTRAFFSDTETSAANVFSAGSLNLKVGINAPDSQWPTVAPRDNNNQQLFAIGGLMPGQEGTGELRLLSEGGDAWACVSAEITGNPENTRLSQEQSSGDTSAGANSGELAQYMEIALWEANGLANSDGVVGPNEKETLQVMSLEEFANGEFYTLQDSDFEDNPLMSGEEYRHEFAYCFGEFSNNEDVLANGGTLECDGGIAGTNVAQTDGVELLLSFYAEQMESNEEFTCSSIAGGDDDDNGGEVTPGDLMGWEAYDDEYAEPADGSATLVDGDSTVGDGSLRLETIGGNSRVGLFNTGFELALAGAELSYDSRQISATDVANGNATIRIMIDTDNDGDVDDQLMYEPYYNGFDGTTMTGWETWTINETQGELWSNYQVEYNNITNTGAGGAGQMVTLADVLIEYPSAEIVGISFSMGTGNADQVVLVDNFVLNGTVYDFEG